MRNCFTFYPFIGIALLLVAVKLIDAKDVSQVYETRSYLALSLMFFLFILPIVILPIFHYGKGSGMEISTGVLGVLYAFVGIVVVPTVVIVLLIFDAVRKNVISVKLRDLSSIIIPLPVILVKVMIDMYSFQK